MDVSFCLPSLSLHSLVSERDAGIFNMRMKRQAIGKVMKSMTNRGITTGRREKGDKDQAGLRRAT